MGDITYPCGDPLDNSAKKREQSNEAKEQNEQEIRAENKKLLETVIQYSKLESRRKPETVLLIGLPGSGKTSVINTIYQELTGLDGSFAATGSGSTQAKTLAFKWYKHFGIVKANIVDPDLRRKIGPIVNKLPNIIDCAGKGDVNDEDSRELLRLTLEGKIPPDTKISDTLRGKRKPNRDWIVRKIIFVQPTNVRIPEQLLEMLNEVLKETNTYGQMKYSTTVFTLFSKFDCVETGVVTEEEFGKNRMKLAKLLCIGNNLKENSIPWKNYCDTISRPSLTIQNSVLKLIKQIQCPQPQTESMSDSNDLGLCAHCACFFAFVSLLIAIWMAMEGYRRT